MSLSDSGFYRQLIPEREGILGEIKRSAHEGRRVPIIRDDAALLLEILVSQKKPERILEIGTAIGYSSIVMAEASPCVKHIDTVEISPDAVSEARENIRKAGLEERIRVILGDGAEVCSCLTGAYDLIFLDGAKSQYTKMYDDIKRLLSPGGLLVCDDVMFYGKTEEAPEDSPHKHRTIVANMRDFLLKIFNDKDYRSVILDVGDGMSLSEKM